MAFDEQLAGRVRNELSGVEGLTERKMFGGLGFMLHGNMCCGVQSDELMVRTGPDAYAEALARPHARPMDFTGRAMKGFLYVAAEGLRDKDSLAEWVRLGADFARSLPPKR